MSDAEQERRENEQIADILDEDAIREQQRQEADQRAYEDAQ
jgi:hypothetical protein